MKIMIIEDSVIVRDLIEFNLRNSFKCEVKKLESGELAVEEVKKEKPDLIILDHHLDSQNKRAMTGELFLQHLKKTGQKIPIIMFSGQKKLALTIEAFRKDIVDYVSKNSETFIDELLEAVGNVVTTMNIRDAQKMETKQSNQRLIKGMLITTLVLFSMFVVWCFAVGGT